MKETLDLRGLNFEEGYIATPRRVFNITDVPAPGFVCFP